MTAATLSKSDLMCQAWAKFRECRGLVAFAECLRRAWRTVKLDRAMRTALAALPSREAIDKARAAIGWRRPVTLRTQYGLRFLGR